MSEYWQAIQALELAANTIVRNARAKCSVVLVGIKFARFMN